MPERLRSFEKMSAVWYRTLRRHLHDADRHCLGVELSADIYMTQIGAVWVSNLTLIIICFHDVNRLDTCI